MVDCWMAGLMGLTVLRTVWSLITQVSYSIFCNKNTFCFLQIKMFKIFSVDDFREFLKKKINKKMNSYI